MVVMVRSDDFARVGLGSGTNVHTLFSGWCFSLQFGTVTVSNSQGTLPPTVKFVVGILIIRSGTAITRTVRTLLIDRRCTISVTVSNLRKLRVTRICDCSLVLLSVKLPNVSKMDLYRRLHDQKLRAPVLLLAKRSIRTRTGTITLGTKTSSCIAGPFSARRLLTQLRALLQQNDLGTLPILR